MFMCLTTTYYSNSSHNSELVPVAPCHPLGSKDGSSSLHQVYYVNVTFDFRPIGSYSSLTNSLYLALSTDMPHIARFDSLSEDPLYHESHAATIYIPAAVFLAVCPIIVGTRIWSRVGNGGKMGPDDYTILVALVS